MQLYKTDSVIEKRKSKYSKKILNNQLHSILTYRYLLQAQATLKCFEAGESSSQFHWFTIAKIELQFLIFFVLIVGLRLQIYSTNTKRCPPKKVFGNSEFFVLPAKTTVLQTVRPAVILLNY